MNTTQLTKEQSRTVLGKTFRGPCQIEQDGSWAMVTYLKGHTDYNKGVRQTFFHRQYGWLKSFAMLPLPREWGG